jgi:K+-transporting ATPase ATPase B chain
MTTKIQQVQVARPLFDPAIVKVAAVDAFKKLDPRRMIRNPVMFVVEIGSTFTLVLALHAAVTGQGEHRALRELRRSDGRRAR